MCKKLNGLVAFVLVLSMVRNVPADLLVHWRLDEGSGTITADTSGNGRDGTFTGDPQWVTGHNNPGALHFDGVDDFVSHVLPGDQAYAAFTIAVWAKADDVDQAQLAAVFASRFPGGATGAGFQLDIDTQVTPQVYQIRPNNDSGIFGNATTDWVHLAVVCEGVSAQLYYQGVPTNQATLVSNLFNEFTIGVNRARSRFFAGAIDDLRVYDHALTDAEILRTMEGEPFPFALNPTPADGALHEDTWANLSWSPGALAVSHDVYLGDNFDDVNDGVGDTFRGNQEGTFLVIGLPGFPYPDGLVPGTTYYWRIDEVNDVDPNSPWKGDVWSFSIPPKTAYDPDPANGADSVATDARLSWTPGFGAKLHTVYLGDDLETIANATVGISSGPASYTPGSLEQEKVYYWRIDEFDGLGTYKGDVWAFATLGAVGNPQPANGATDMGMATILSWTPADNATSHQVYLGLDKDTVRSADTGSPEYKGSKALGGESYDPGLLEPGTTYYWRVDAVYNGNPVKGLVWSFTVGDYILIEDFESYTDDDPNNEAIWQTWIDGFGVADNGAQVGNLIPPYCELTIVHGGSQSMPLLYTNEAGVTNSEASLTLAALRDWTQAGVAELSLWFRGTSGNAVEPLYVAVYNSVGVPGIITHDDPSAATVRSWVQWRVPLQAFAVQGINLTSVDKIAIGLGSKGGVAAGGTGTVYIDDIRLY
ncbi:MAG: hypothetical protein JXM79_12170 [Sedimentisphaerales bacterium]|nr:hypothetical protein [Sedimentisphaerales bacterium]